jgi:hypothetical protein
MLKYWGESSKLKLPSLPSQITQVIKKFFCLYYNKFFQIFFVF